MLTKEALDYLEALPLLTDLERDLSALVSPPAVVVIRLETEVLPLN